MTENGDPITIEVGPEMWNRFFTVSPLVIVGTKEEDGTYDLAPKHMAMPLGWQGHFGFVCTPDHMTYWNAKREGVFTVSYPRPSEVVFASMAASPRDADRCKPSLAVIGTIPSPNVDGVFFEDGYLYFECELESVLDDFGTNSLIIGRIVAAHVRPEGLRQSDGDDQELLFAAPLLAYLHPGRFSPIRETFAFPFVEPEES